MNNYNPLGGYATNSGFIESLYDNNPSMHNSKALPNITDSPSIFSPTDKTTNSIINPGGESNTKESSTKESETSKSTTEKNESNTTSLEKSKHEVTRLLSDPAERKRINLLAMTLKESFSEFGANDNEKVKKVLESLKPEELAALEVSYGQLEGKNDPAALRKDIKSHLDPLSFENTAKTGGIIGLGIAAAKGLSKLGKIGKIAGAAVGLLAGGAAVATNAYNIGQDLSFSDKDAIKILNKGANVHPEVAQVALREAMEGLGTDEDTVKEIMTNKNDQFINEVNEGYEGKFGISLTKQIKGDFNWVFGGPEKQYEDRILNAQLNTKPKEEAFGKFKAQVDIETEKQEEANQFYQYSTSYSH